MNILFTLCGRAGSKGVKNKNVRSFCGAPISFYSLAAIELYRQRFGKNDNIYVTVNTDSELLVKTLTEQSIIPVYHIDRDEALAGDAVPKVAVIQDCLEKCEKYFNIQFNVVVDLDITSPLRTVEDIHRAIQMKVQRTDTDAIYSVTEARRNPSFNMVKEVDGFSVPVIESNYTSRQQAPPIFDMNASIYAYSPQALKNKSPVGFFNKNCYYITMKDTGILDIDSEEDFELLQVVAGYLYEKDDKHGLIKQYLSAIESSETT